LKIFITNVLKVAETDLNVSFVLFFSLKKLEKDNYEVDQVGREKD